MTVLRGDCRDILPTLPECSFDAIVTDPPYHLTTGKKGGSGEASVNLDSPYGRARVTTGFMGMKWDGGDVAFDPETWRKAFRVLKPGGYLLAFGGTRTYHRMVCAIEDSGFEIRDQIMWIYGSGFPKSLNVSKALDDAAGAEREIVGKAPWSQPAKSGHHAGLLDPHVNGNGQRFTPAITAPATELAQQWDGWGTALKPAHEPIVVARKPLIGTVAENIVEHGCGALNIDGCRIDPAEGSRPQRIKVGGASNGIYGDGLNNSRAVDDTTLGRWPANVVHDGSTEVVALFPAEAGAAAPVYRRNGDKFRNEYGAFAGDVDEQHSTFRGDSGSAARFFYCAKASREDRDEGLDGFDKKPLLWSSGTQNPGSFQSPNTEREARNFHPTVKPTALMRWLVRLVTPPDGKVLDLFAGSGSTGKACELEGFDYVLIEGDEQYIPIIKARLEFAREERRIATAQHSLFADGATA